MRHKESELFTNWKIRHSRMVEDGIVNFEDYENCKIRVLYILKEVNSEQSNWSLKDFLHKGGRAATWDNIALWQYGLLNSHIKFKWNEINKKRTEKFRKENLRTISVINVKKTPGSHVSNNKELSRFVKEDKDLIKRQISIYNPNLIICCGTAGVLKEFELLGSFTRWNVSSCGIQYHISETNQIVINFCHPEARINDNYKFFPLIETYNEIISEQNILNN